MKSSKKLQILSHLLFVYLKNQDRKLRMSVLFFSSALACIILETNLQNLFIFLRKYHSYNFANCIPVT